jgi:hypothetical protein
MRRSDPALLAAPWIASSQELLAMTGIAPRFVRDGMMKW